MVRRHTEAELRALVVEHPPYRPPILGIAAVTTLVLLAIVALVSFASDLDDCTRRGGTVVRTFGGGYVCAKLQELR